MRSKERRGWVRLRAVFFGEEFLLLLLLPPPPFTYP